ncbi:hypothetical protein [Streptomyces sp. GQFP]|uniref:hypothetical protein n=1 Tax=Streptomyces sp. GQFP TaxID=2907545 RepID=UPI001F405229|nr:hypothetical protein [Streptomyces sp. GQFP]UIX32458.1 hypothetical protein LUX31_21800 [Streptomyces sp. GQFP]
MSSKRRLIVAGLTVILMAGLGACGGEGGQDDNPWQDSKVSGDSAGDQYDEGTDEGVDDAPPTVSGLRNAVRHLPRKTTKATRPHTVRKCTTSSKSGKSGKSGRSTRTCKTVRSGTETYTRVVRQELWCVSLDDVNGDTSKDAVWYEVTSATYDEAVAAEHHAPLSFAPKTTTPGCTP